MFRQRTSSQKPGLDLLTTFRQQFPELVTGNNPSSIPPHSQPTTDSDTLRPQTVPKNCNSNADSESFQAQDATPRASHEPWRLTPSVMDHASYTFGEFGNAAAGFYTPAADGAASLFHTQTCIMGSPGGRLAPAMVTPLSVPTEGHSLQSAAAVMEIADFPVLQPHGYHGFNPFAQAQQPQQSFSPSSLMPREVEYEKMEQDGSPMESNPSEERMPSLAAALHSQDVTILPLCHPGPVSAGRFRFHSALNAPTAMVRHADEIPVTYLNKGQAYSLSVSDTTSPMPMPAGTRYRTFVRISFEDEEQRQKPGICWGLWKEGRGISESHQRGGKLQAVEYIESSEPAEGDDKRTRIELESSSFDGFSVIWTPGCSGAAEVGIPVRFNFLSTDFSHSKGVKGIPVRLCAKTNMIWEDSRNAIGSGSSSEICFCKVKLFRDHGAERKLSNDVAHVKKSMEKLKQQLAQSESGVKDSGKRRRHTGASKVSDPQHHGKAPKHKRNQSVSSISSAGGGAARLTLEEDLLSKLQTLQEMFTSTRPVSVLYLLGEKADDPDLFPVSLPGDMTPPGLNEAASRQEGRGDPSAPVSPRTVTFGPRAHGRGSLQGGDWRRQDPQGPEGDVTGAESEQPVRIPKMDQQGASVGWIEALEVDGSYRPPPDLGEKPVVCFYMQYWSREGAGKRTYHRAIYLRKRTLEELNGRIASKWGLDAARIQRTIKTLEGGLEIEVDDDYVREMREGQNMKLEVEETSGLDRCGLSGDVPDEQSSRTTKGKAPGLVLRLTM